MQRSHYHRTLALAGLFQSVRLVQQVAREGRCDSAAWDASVQSLFKFEANAPEEIYGGLGGLRLGFETLVSQFQSRDPAQAMELTRYVIGLIHLERRLDRQSQVQDELQKGLEAAEQQQRYFGEINASVIGRLADLYKETISGLGPRIMVQGDPQSLEVEDNAARIRVLLLAGIRACVLWRQAGGNRWRLILNRRAIYNEAQRQLALIDAETDTSLS
jgi:high frequency lysogenization protein